MQHLKIPKAFLGYDENIEGKATLAAEDIRFARTIERLQRIMVSELNKIALVHLYAQGYRDEALTNFEISMQTPSIIFEQEKIELMKSKTELAQTLKDQKSYYLQIGFMITFIIYQKISMMNMRDLMREDAKRDI